MTEKPRESGVIEARLTLLATDAGGLREPISTGYSAYWNIGNRTASGDVELNDARITVEGGEAISPGQTGLVRLHPLAPERWWAVRVDDRLVMNEGHRVLGFATVVGVHRPPSPRKR